MVDEPVTRACYIPPVIKAEGGGGRRGPDGVDAEFGAFFAQHYNELARFAFLLVGDHAAADDVAAEALAEAWKGWARVSTADRPLAYVRRIAANIAANRTDRQVKERRSWRLWGGGRSEQAPRPDSEAAVDLQAALLRLPARKRACVVLRYYYDLSERETAATLGISVGTVKSQSSRGLEELATHLRGSRAASVAAHGRRRSAAEGVRR
jgi:RNA polymerase sigma-70 factor (sigma-E family)